MRIFPEYYVIFTFTDKYLEILERDSVLVLIQYTDVMQHLT